MRIVVIKLLFRIYTPFICAIVPLIHGVFSLTENLTEDFAFERFGLTKPEEITWGDIAYAANMHYADCFGVSLKTETDCVRQAYADAADPDGYPGKIFNRRFADVLGSKKAVPWDDFI